MIVELISFIYFLNLEITPVHSQFDCPSTTMQTLDTGTLDGWDQLSSDESIVTGETFNVVVHGWCSDTSQPCISIRGIGGSGDTITSAIYLEKTLDVSGWIDIKIEVQLATSGVTVPYIAFIETVCNTDSPQTIEVNTGWGYANHIECLSLDLTSCDTLTVRIGGYLLDTTYFVFIRQDVKLEYSTLSPTSAPTRDPTKDPTRDPTKDPTQDPTRDPTTDPTDDPTRDPTTDPTYDPTRDPTSDPTIDPTRDPTQDPTRDPTRDPTHDPTDDPTQDPTTDPTFDPTTDPTTDPTAAPSSAPTSPPTAAPSTSPTDAPSLAPSLAPSHAPTHSIRIIPKEWYDDYIYNEKIGLHTDGTIGWIAHNADRNITSLSHMWEPETLTGTLDLRGDGIIHTITYGYTDFADIFHGPFWRQMMAVGDGGDTERDFVTLRRHFECKSQSLVTISYTVLFCRNNLSETFLHGLSMSQWNNTSPIDILDINSVDMSSDEYYSGNDSEILDCATDPQWITFNWNTTYTAYDDIAWILSLRFQMKDNDYWFMMTNISIICDLKYPSAAPTNAPTLAPSYSPSIAPTNAPTYSPLTCPDYGMNYSTVDGIDEVLNPYDYVTYTVLGPNAINITADEDEPLIGETLNCTTSDGCNFYCNYPVSCLVATFNCESDTGCNIYCMSKASCTLSVIYVTHNPGANITVICAHESACQDIRIETKAVSRAEIHCLEEDSCISAQIVFDQVSIYNNPNTFVACYASESCESLKIYADGPYSRLHMYEYSSYVQIFNGNGYYPSLNTVSCGIDTKFIKWDLSDDNSMESLVSAEYANSILPCAGVTIYCNDTDLDIFCEMEYIYRGVDVDISRSPYIDAHCVYVWLSEVVHFRCTNEGELSCGMEPTKDPTPAPTFDPTFSPSQAPSDAPSYSPSGVPSLSPSKTPTLAPTYSPTLAPSISPTPAPSLSPTFAPTGAPTKPPTQAPSPSPTLAPTTVPTRSGNIYDTRLDIVYVFTNLNDANNQWLLSHLNDETSSIDELIEFISREYFVDAPVVLGSYEVYDLVIETINKYEFSALTDNILTTNVNNDGEVEIYVESYIEFNTALLNHFKSTSNASEWQSAVNKSVKTFFNNTDARFSVWGNMTITEDDTDEPFDWIFVFVNVFLVVFIILGVIAMLHNIGLFGAHNRDKVCYPVDNGIWMSLVVFGVQIYDMASDINLTREIFVVMANRECQGPSYIHCVPDENLPGDELTKVDTFRERVLVVSGVLSLMFLAIPYALNLAYAARLPSNHIIKQNPAARVWFETYQMFYIALVVLSGGCYPSLNLISSNIFGLNILNAGLSSFELSSLSAIRVITTVITENVPQLAVQIMYSYAIGDVTSTTVLAFSTSVASIVASILNFFINKDKMGQVYDIFYYFELKIKHDYNTLEQDEHAQSQLKLTTKERRYIKKKKGIKLDLAKKIVKIYPDVDIAAFEIGYITVRSDNFVIRVGQHLHEKDLNIALNYDDYEAIVNKRQREEQKKKPFKNHCYELYATNREEIENIIFAHFDELDRHKFDLIYHKEYPHAKNAEKLLKSDNATQNIRDLIKQNEGDNDDIDDEEEKQRLIAGYRDEFKSAFGILDSAITKYVDEHKRNRDETLPNSQIIKFKHLLQSNNVEHVVIEDVLKFAEYAQLCKTEEAHESDIESSDGSVDLFRENQAFVARRRQRKHARSIQNEMQPSWFVTRGDTTPDDGGEGKKKKKKKKTPRKLHTEIELNTMNDDSDTWDAEMNAQIKQWLQ